MSKQVSPDTPDEPIIAIRDASKTYPGSRRPAVAGIDLSIRRGDFFGLLGPNGAGKTTLLSMICGLLQPDGGQIRVQRHDVATELPAVKRLLGFVPQDLALYGGLTARENLEYFGSMQGLRGRRLRERVRACLWIGKLEDFAQRRVAAFSGGLKRRLNLAIGLLHEPELLILDEPTVGIDPQSRNFIFESLREINAAGVSIVYTTHYMEEVEQLCSEIAIIDRGRIIMRGSLDELLNAHHGGRLQLRLAAPPPPGLRARLEALPGLTVERASGKLLVLRSDKPWEAVNRTLAVFAEQNLDITSLAVGAMNLEQLFLELTGTRLRD